MSNDFIVSDGVNGIDTHKLFICREIVVILIFDFRSQAEQKYDFTIDFANNSRAFLKAQKDTLTLKFIHVGLGMLKTSPLYPSMRS